ncbi:MAG TPA: flagellar biosynthesis protein FlgN [Hyphomicrobium sp.]|nr:flagellar biosynthesis protein FlgN [Hyphomicrobium sp.]
MLQRPSYFAPSYPPAGQASPPLPSNPMPGLPAGAGGSAPVSMLEISLQRLEEIVDQETTALKQRETIDLKAFNDRKSQALLELTRWMRNMSGVEATPEIAARIGALKEKLLVNQAVLKLHLEAVREISASMADAIQQSESDGTYTQAISAAYRPL